jgi:hypothetical protein
MCFSASASFTASAVLMPLGLYATHIARTTDQKDYVPLALTPFFFGVQQLTEGLVWTGIDNGRTEPRLPPWPRWAFCSSPTASG